MSESLFVVSNVIVPEPVIIPTPHLSQDERGYFARTYERPTTLVANFHVAEENESLSRKAGTIRGLHWQEPMQVKVVRVLDGDILDVCVQIQTRQVRTFRLIPASGSLFVPKGWAHGFCTCEDNTRVLYKVNQRYAPNAQMGFNPFDPKLRIEWPVSQADAIMSERDRNAPLL
jgi:dTDP-4-dehydrorhamnose 3,5-epimerase